MINRMRRYKGFEVITEKQGLVSYLQQAGCRLDWSKSGESAH